MARTLTCIALAILSASTASAQERSTLRLRVPMYFGFAVDCAGCNQVADTTRRPQIITRVSRNSPAERGALRVGDTILTVNDKVTSARELTAFLAQAKPDTPLRMQVGSSRGRFTYHIRPSFAPVVTLGKDTLPVRYTGEYAEVTVEVLSMSAPVVTKDSAGAMLIRMGEHVIRLQRTP